MHRQHVEAVILLIPAVMPRTPDTSRARLILAQRRCPIPLRRLFFLLPLPGYPLAATLRFHRRHNAQRLLDPFRAGESLGIPILHRALVVLPQRPPWLLGKDSLGILQQQSLVTLDDQHDVLVMVQAEV